MTGISKAFERAKESFCYRRQLFGILYRGNGLKKWSVGLEYDRFGLSIITKHLEII
jgi:hypothetical protein